MSRQRAPQYVADEKCVHEVFLSALGEGHEEKSVIEQAAGLGTKLTRKT